MKSIWVVDDDHSIRFVLEKALAREGLPVRSFSNARDMLAALDDDGRSTPHREERSAERPALPVSIRR